MLDFHTHVWEHGPGTPVPKFEQLERYCEVAAAAGISQLAITEHAHRFERIQNQVFPHWDRARTGDLSDAIGHVNAVERGGDLDAYVAALVDAQDRGLPLMAGLEVDGLSGANEAMAELLAGYPFDVLLGSVHSADFRRRR